GVLAGVLEVLRHRPHRAELEDPVPLADGGAPFDHRVRADPGAFADLHGLADHRVRADLHAVVELGLRVDDRGGMQLRHQAAPPASTSTTVARNSPSATFCPSTVAVPRCFQMAPLCFITSTSSISRSPGTTGLRNLALSMAIRYVTLRVGSIPAVL